MIRWSSLAFIVTLLAACGSDGEPAPDAGDGGFNPSGFDPEAGFNPGPGKTDPLCTAVDAYRKRCGSSCTSNPLCPDFIAPLAESARKAQEACTATAACPTGKDDPLTDCVQTALRTTAPTAGQSAFAKSWCAACSPGTAGCELELLNGVGLFIRYYADDQLSELETCRKQCDPISFAICAGMGAAPMLGSIAGRCDSGS